MNFIEPSLLQNLAPEGAQTLGVRPEHCALIEAGAGVLIGTVAFCEALGADTLVHVRMTDDAVLIVRSEGDPIEAGTSVGISLDTAQIIAFDSDGKAMAA